MSKRRYTTSDALEILDSRYFHGRPGRLRALAEARLNAQIAQEIYQLRTRAGLTQKQLAELVGTTDSAISRLEDADYSGHSLKMLQRISTALNRQIEIHFVPIRARRKVSA
jgi:DNA-binding XRE family transcriptional regulator